MRLPCLVALTLFAASADAADDAGLRAAFRAAYEVAQASVEDSAQEAALSGYVLYPYLQAARLRLRLTRTPAEADAAIGDFLRAHADEAVIVRLRRAWLLSLAERRQWKAFLDALPPQTSDATLRCHALAARVALKQTRGLRDDITGIWLTAQEQPDACDPAFDWLRAQGALTQDLVRQRAHMALLAGQAALAQALIARLPASKTTRALAAAASLLQSPQTEFARQLSEGLPEAAITLAAYAKLARRDSMQALSLLEPVALQLNDEERTQQLREAALGLAYDHRTEAVKLFRALDSNADSLAQEWRLRSAIWGGDWNQALEWIAQMPVPAQREPRWLYWRARAFEQTGKDIEARIAYTEAAQAREYYGFLAAERLGIPALIDPQPLAPDPKAGALLEKNPAFIRARELVLCELSDEAAPEFRQAIANLDAASQKEAARLVAGWGWHHQAILTLSALGEWDDVVLRYPLPFTVEIANAAKESAVPAEQIYSVMRQESLYNPRAVSGAGAYGLLQLLPSTARMVAVQFRLPRPSARDLLQPALNLRLGALHLRELLADFRGSWPLTLAAYNAGARRVLDWLPPLEMPADVWIENIPFNETRLYVQRILGHRVLFGWRLNGQPLEVLPLLGDIPPAIDGPLPPAPDAAEPPPLLEPLPSP